jgi:hypothetical protein
MDITFFGFLHLAEKETTSVNLGVKDFEQQMVIYLKCAINLSYSLNREGISFVLLTNDKNRIDEVIKRWQLSDSLEIKEIDFPLRVVTGLKFYSSHYKINVLQYLASLEPESYIGYIDLDVIAINSMPESLTNIAQEKIPLCYDISDQVIPAYGHEVILRDMKRISPLVFEGRWTGGELIMGTPAFFASVSQETEKIFNIYLNIVKELHHQGNETSISVALEILRRRGMYIADAGTLGIVGRYWGVPVKHPQRALAYFEKCFLLHLPADKEFLSSLSPEEAVNGDCIINKYREYLQQKKIMRVKENIIRNCINFLRPIKRLFIK